MSLLTIEMLKTNHDQQISMSMSKYAQAIISTRNEAIDEVLEIIDRHIVIQEMKYTEANDILYEITAEIRATEAKEIRNEVLVLKGKQE